MDDYDDYDEDNYDNTEAQYDDYGMIIDEEDKKEEEDIYEDAYESDENEKNISCSKKNINKFLKERITNRQMSSYEYDRLNGILTTLINTSKNEPNAFKVHPLVFELHKKLNPEEPMLSSSSEIADFWLEHCKEIPFPLKVKRIVGKYYEEWHPMEMILPTELDSNYLFEEELNQISKDIKQNLDNIMDKKLN